MPCRDLLEAVAREAGVTLAAEPPAPISGGSAQRVYRLATSGGPLLLKVARRERLPMLEAEADGLRALAAADAIAVPAVAATVGAGDVAALAVEWIELAGGGSRAETRLGEGLAVQHACTAERHGWHRDNTIGPTEQRNPPTADWTAFFRDARLGFQLELAEANGLGAVHAARGRRLLARLDALLEGHRPAPSLLHGDLWGGNWGATREGVPYVYDPAVYYGDREADLAMTRLFGGFGAAFYRAYEAAWPLEPGWERRVDLYNLYHLLNHFNLFGGGYRGQVASVLARLEADA